MTDVWVVLKRIEELESALSKFYEWLEKLFSYEEDTRLAFTHLSMEEAGHRDLVQFRAKV